MERYILIRRYLPGDKDDCRRIVYAGTMSTVRLAFVAYLTREVTLHLLVLNFAWMFVFMSLSPISCLLAVPMTGLMLYCAIHVAHVLKARGDADDMANIPVNYMSSEFTGFWVAELYEPKSNAVRGHVNIVRGINWRPPEGEFVRRIVGTAGLVRSHTDSCASRMRRLSVDKDCQRLGIAAALVDELISFGREKGYEMIELVTTEFHTSARALYMKKGFELRQLYHKQIFLNIIQILMYEFTFRLDTDK